jgi:hypothetical protein
MVNSSSFYAFGHHVYKFIGIEGSKEVSPSIPNGLPCRVPTLSLILLVQVGELPLASSGRSGRGYPARGVCLSGTFKRLVNGTTS